MDACCVTEWETNKDVNRARAVRLVHESHIGSKRNASKVSSGLVHDVGA